ncbi:hypothetical protein Pan258_02060 [Symmachiella dynata]|uniref:hypothetical protein n=1 Tax=Symmachiella dynata TaxID=2527995 RepID=UPI001187DF3F|nr:hypothetical protein [Symmachiella dynata]QDT46189.1 hypothetical protein Pan258_02060 [Symmachiella dynata]
MPKTKKESAKLTPKQKKLIQLLPLVEEGKITKMEAFKRAGYADSTAREQTTVLGQIGSNTKMQEALKKVGFTEEYLATGIVEGTQANGNAQGGGRYPDYKTRSHYYKLGAELLDAFPAKKTVNAEVGVEELLNSAEDGSDYAEWNK